MEEKLWEIIDRKSILRDDWIHVMADKVRTTKGKIIDPWYILDYPNWTQIVAVNEKNEILITRQYRHGIRTFEYELPGGFIEDGESPWEASVRELKEETGYTFSQCEQIGCASVSPSSMTNYIYTFLATGDYQMSGQRLDELEDITCRWATVDQVLSWIECNKMCCVHHIAAVLLALRKLNL